MTTNFTVILFQRQQFGNEPGSFDDVELHVPFVGAMKSYSFDCPGINSGETAFLIFQSRDVDHSKNIFQVNGVDVFGGLPASPTRDAWNGNILLIEPHHQLKAAGNVLHVESRNSRGEGVDDLDDFIIDNVVIVYKLADVLQALPSTTGDLAAFLKKEDEEGYRECGHDVMARFLNGLVIYKRGKEESRPPPPVEVPVTNNAILKRLRVAFELKDSDIVSLIEKSGLRVSKGELGAFFRRPDHRNYRDCGDQFLRNLIKGLSANAATN